MLSLSKSDCRHSLMRLVVIAAACLFPMTVSAITLTEYQQKLKQSVTAFDALVLVDEHETESEFKNHLLQTIDAVLVTLPEHMAIEADGEPYAVDNTALHKTLEELKSLSIKDQQKKIDDVKHTRSAREPRIAERIAAT